MKIKLYDMENGFTYIAKRGKLTKPGLWSYIVNTVMSDIAMACEIATFKTEDIIMKSDKEILEMYLNANTESHNRKIEPEKIVSKRTIESKL